MDQTLLLDGVIFLREKADKMHFSSKFILLEQTMEQSAHRIFVEYVRKCAKEHVLLVSMRRRPLYYPSELTENAHILQLKPHKHREAIVEMIHAKLKEYGTIDM